MGRIRFAFIGLVALIAAAGWGIAVGAHKDISEFTVPPERIGDPHETALAHDRDAEVALRKALVAAQPWGLADSYKQATPRERATIGPSLSYVGERTASLGPSMSVSSRASRPGQALRFRAPESASSSRPRRITFGTEAEA